MALFLFFSSKHLGLPLFAGLVAGLISGYSVGLLAIPCGIGVAIAVRSLQVVSALKQPW